MSFDPNRNALQDTDNRSFSILEFIRLPDATANIKVWKKGTHSVAKEAREFAQGIDLHLETEFNGRDKKHGKAQKLKRTAREKRNKAINFAWKAKGLHGQYQLQCRTADADLHDNNQWLTSAGLKLETERFFVATQEQNLFTRNFQANTLHNGADPRCRLFNTSNETIDHLISGCTILALMSVQKDTILIDNADPGRFVIIMILKHSTNGMSMNRSLLWVPQKWPFFRTSLLQVTEQCKLTDQI